MVNHFVGNSNHRHRRLFCSGTGGVSVRPLVDLALEKFDLCSKACCWNYGNLIKSSNLDNLAMFSALALYYLIQSLPPTYHSASAYLNGSPLLSHTSNCCFTTILPPTNSLSYCQLISSKTYWCIFLGANNQIPSSSRTKVDTRTVTMHSNVTSRWTPFPRHSWYMLLVSPSSPLSHHASSLSTYVSQLQFGIIFLVD